MDIAQLYFDRTLKNYPVANLSSKLSEQKNLDLEDLLPHLKWMLLQIIEGKVVGSKAKQWISYIQGELRGAGLFSTQQLREHSKENELGYVCGFMIVVGEVALVTKAKPDWQKGKLNGIGGKIEDGESRHQAMVREFQEETTVETLPFQWERFVVLHTKGSVIHFFRFKAASQARLHGLPDEPVDWYSISRLPENVIPNLTWLIPMAVVQEIREPIEVYE